MSPEKVGFRFCFRSGKALMKHNNPFTRKSKYNKERTSYLDKSFNYVYEYTEYRPDGTRVEKKEIIPYSEDLCEVFKVLDESDHDMDLAQRYEDEHRAKDIINDNGDEDYISPLELIVASLDVESNLLDENESLRKLIVEVAYWMESLPEKQKELIYDHLILGKTFDEIRLEETEKGVVVTKQAIFNRWKKILSKGKKKFEKHF